MKSILYTCLALFVASVYADQSKVETTLDCTNPKIEIDTKWLDMHSKCIDEMRRQIKMEVNASMSYLAMGAHFSTDEINRPGFAKHFFEAAGEERQHAINLMTYLLTRGELTTGVNDLLNMDEMWPEQQTWKSGVDALKHALTLEASVTRSIRGVIKTCEETPALDKRDTQTSRQSVSNDYELVDYLTGEFLKEQYEGQRQIAEKISTLEKMMKNHGPLGEFLFDKKLLE